MNDLKVHLGCGNRIMEGWLNYDINPTDDRVISWRVGQHLRHAEPGKGRLTPSPLEDESAAEIRAYHLIEHIPHSDPREELWFSFWEECWRVLKMGGKMDVIAPHGDSVWAWGDPGHVRAIYPETFVFLGANDYISARDDEHNPMSPYEPHCNFKTMVNVLAPAHERVDELKDPYGNIRAILTKQSLPDGYPRRRRT